MHLTSIRVDCRFMPLGHDHPRQSEDRTIDPLVSLRQAGKALERTPEYVKGRAEGMGIKLMKAGRSLVMTRRDFDRLKRQLAEPAATAAT
jgi:hypothetical protein